MPRNQNHGVNSPLNVPKRRKPDVESVTLKSRSLKPAVTDHLAVARLHKHVTEAAHNPKPVAKDPHVVAQRQTHAVKETATARPNHAKEKNGPQCSMKAIMAVAQALMMEIVVTNTVLVTAKNILRCIATEIVTALPVREMAAKEASLPIMANVVSFTRIADLVMEIADRSADLVTATLRIVTKGHPGSILTAGIVIMDAASAPTHVLVSAHSRRVAR